MVKENTFVMEMIETWPRTKADGKNYSFYFDLNSIVLTKKH